MAFEHCTPRDRAGRGQGRGRGWGRKGGHGPGFRQRGEAQVLDTLDLHLAMLAILSEQPRTGLATMQALVVRGCAGAAARAADVYSGLVLLEETGLLAGSRDEAGRQIYTLTDEGAAALASKRLLADAILADAAQAARNAGRFSGSRHAPRCCLRTAAAIAASIAQPDGTTPAQR